MTRLQGALIGFGNIAEFGHWPTYVKAGNCDIVAVVEPSSTRQAAAKACQPAIHVYSTVEELFRTEKLDFVDICTPPASHAALAQRALENGCHVLCEKPLSLKVSEYEALARESVARDKTVFTVHNWKYAPIFQKAFSLIREGRIGPVWHVEIFTLRNTHCKGTAQGAADTAGPSEDWRTDPAIAGGGILVDHGWHAFYLLQNLVQAAPESILAKMLRDRENPNSLEEAVQALVQFPEADGYVHLTWRSKMRRNNVIVQGQNGTLLLDDDRILLTTHDGEKQEIAFESALSAGSHHAEWFEALWPDFVEEVHNPAKRGANLKEAGWCLALLQAAYQSNLHGFKEMPVPFPGTVKPAEALA
ncbi:MAG: Gfo/Idh/MocA family oxidoreductase [Elusimicrobiota bacterium]|jgi:predicted dehydrogenase